MSGYGLAALLTAAALCAPGAPPASRLRGGAAGLTTKSPRDGPRGRRAPAFDRHRAAADISLFAVCYSAGLTAQASAAAVAESYRPGSTDPLAEKWRTTASLLALGVEPERAWADFHEVPGGADLAGVVALSHASGTAVTAGCQRIADQLTHAATDDATAKAERAGVLIAIPLTAFFLPAFFVLGLIPTAISLGASLT